VPPEVPPAVPDTTRETVSPPPWKLRFVVVTPGLVGLNCTAIVAVAPNPARLKGLPDTTLNGAPTEAAPVTVPPRVFVTVNSCVVVPPTLTLPKLAVAVGVTPNIAPATALVTFEHALSSPRRLSAVTATWYCVPELSPLRRVVTVSPGRGICVGDATEMKDEPGHGAEELA
jgi:hypothetical protein